MAGHVYLIGSRRFHWYKIGKSADARIRVADLGILLPFRIEVLAVWKAENHHALEKLLHEKFSSNRINGEWFDLSHRQIDVLVSEMRMAKVNVAAGFSNDGQDAIPLERMNERIDILTGKKLALEREVARLTRENAELKAKVSVSSTVVA